MGSVTLADVGRAVIYLGAVAAALAAIGVVVRFAVVRPMKAWLREQIKPQLTAVHQEVTPNHGTSMRDAVDRIERRLDDHITHHPGSAA